MKNKKKWCQFLVISRWIANGFLAIFTLPSHLISSTILIDDVLNNQYITQDVRG